MITEKQINKLKLEYSVMLKELEEDKQRLSEEKVKLKSAAEKMTKMQDEIDTLTIEIGKLEDKLKKDEKTYIDEKSLKLLKRVITVQIILSLSLAVISPIYNGTFFSNLLINIFSIIAHLGLGTFLVGGIFALCEKKYITNLKNKYKETSEYINTKMELDKKIELKNQKTKELNDSEVLEDFYALNKSVSIIYTFIMKKEKEIKDFKLKVFNELFSTEADIKEENYSLEDHQTQDYTEKKDKIEPLIKVRKP